MSVYIPKGSEDYWFDFWRGGNRFRGATGKKNRRDALQVEKDKKREIETALADAPAARSSLAFNHVMARYWEFRGKHHAGADNTFRDLARLQDYLNAAGITHISDLTDADVGMLIARRRAEAGRALAAGTINRSTIEPLRKLFTFCKKREYVRFDHEPNWTEHLFKEPNEHPRELRSDEAEKLGAAVREDYAPLIAFARATGLRQREIYTLRWSEVFWDEGQIRKQGKGGQLVTRPITSEMRGILWPLRDHHPEFVFTYVADRTQNVPTGKRGGGGHGKRVKGKRYPISKGNLWSRWRRDRAASGVTDFKFHDYRHDVATKALRETRDLKLVGRMLGHADLRSTMRYAHVLDDDVAAAFEKLSEARSPKGSPKTLQKIK